MLFFYGNRLIRSKSWADTSRTIWKAKEKKTIQFNRNKKIKNNRGKIIRDLKLRPLANDARNKDTVSGQVFGNAVFFFVTSSDTSPPAATRHAHVRRTDTEVGDCMLFIYLFSFCARKLLPAQLLMDVGNERDRGWVVCRISPPGAVGSAIGPVRVVGEGSRRRLGLGG